MIAADIDIVTPQAQSLAVHRLPTLFDEPRLLELHSALGSLRLNGLLALLAGECRSRPPRFRAHLVRGDFSGLRAEAHNLKGAALSLGALALAEVAQSIEQVPDLAAATVLLDRLDRISIRTAHAAAARRADLPADRVTT